MPTRINPPSTGRSLNSGSGKLSRSRMSRRVSSRNVCACAWGVHTRTLVDAHLPPLPPPPLLLTPPRLLPKSSFYPSSYPPPIHSHTRLQSSLRWIWNVNDLNYLVERFTLLTAFVEELFFSMEKAQCMLDFADNTSWSGPDAKPPCRCGCS